MRPADAHEDHAFGSEVDTWRYAYLETISPSHFIGNALKRTPAEPLSHVPSQPPNAFILLGSSLVLRQYSSESFRITGDTMSKIATDIWRSLGPSAKLTIEGQANYADSLHTAMAVDGELAEGEHGKPTKHEYWGFAADITDSWSRIWEQGRGTVMKHVNRVGSSVQALVQGATGMAVAVSCLAGTGEAGLQSSTAERRSRYCFGREPPPPDLGGAEEPEQRCGISVRRRLFACHFSIRSTDHSLSLRSINSPLPQDFTYRQGFCDSRLRSHHHHGRCTFTLSVKLSQGLPIIIDIVTSETGMTDLDCLYRLVQMVTQSRFD